MFYSNDNWRSNMQWAVFRRMHSTFSYLPANTGALEHSHSIAYSAYIHDSVEAASYLGCCHVCRTSVVFSWWMRYVWIIKLELQYEERRGAGGTGGALFVSWTDQSWWSIEEHNSIKASIHFLLSTSLPHAKVSIYLTFTAISLIITAMVSDFIYRAFPPANILSTRRDSSDNWNQPCKYKCAQHEEWEQAQTIH